MLVTANVTAKHLVAVGFKPYCYICYILIGKILYNIVVVVVRAYRGVVCILQTFYGKNVTPVTVAMNPCGRRAERVLHLLHGVL